LCLSSELSEELERVEREEMAPNVGLDVLSEVGDFEPKRRK
jgi:hypothetical protein